jgi:hypothetical protein
MNISVASLNVSVVASVTTSLASCQIFRPQILDIDISDYTLSGLITDVIILQFVGLCRCQHQVDPSGCGSLAEFEKS